MNTQLGNGKVHARMFEDSKLPACGGNKGSERYRLTSKDVTCLKCLAELDKQAKDDERNPDYAGVAETQDDVMSQAKPVAETPAEWISEGDIVAIADDTAIDQPSGWAVTIPAGTRGQVVEVFDGPRSTEYLVRFDGRRDEWLYASEIRPVREAPVTELSEVRKASLQSHVRVAGATVKAGTPVTVTAVKYGDGLLPQYRVHLADGTQAWVYRREIKF